MHLLKSFIRTWLGIDEQEQRILTLERHFVTKRDQQGQPIQTLADVAVKDRKELKPSLRGMNMQQRRAWLEETDGGRNIAQQQVSINAR